MVVFSYYPADPRPRRAAESLVREGMEVDLICLRESEREQKREKINGVEILRLPLRRRRGGAVGYVFQYVAFALASLAVLAGRALTRRYDLVYVHNMPDILVLSGLGPKLCGAKVILDLHDPMPELMMTIFNLGAESVWVKLLKRLEKWSIGWSDVALTVNLACKKLFVSRSCRTDKMRVVMNAPDEDIFTFQPPRGESAHNRSGSKPFVIMYHGSLVERNGLDLAIDALAMVRRSAPKVELRVYGPETPFLRRVLELARTRGLLEGIRYLGPRRLEEIVAAIADCDLGIIPNRRSRFTELNTPTRIFEYLAIGKPVVAPRTAGILDYFNNDSLVLFEAGDAEDLARGIEQVLADPRKAEARVRRGQEIYRAHAWRQEREVLVGLVEEVLNSGSWPRSLGAVGTAPARQ
jgi:glycosyltransferase involved in cell wall biosynthesis